MKDFGSISFAARGTVIGCSSEDPEVVDVLFDEPFPSGTNLGGRCSIMRGASVPVKYLLNVSTVCAPAISNSSVKLEKPVSKSPSHFAAAHDSVILATDVPVASKGSHAKVVSQTPVRETAKPIRTPSAFATDVPVASKGSQAKVISQTPVLDTSKPISAPSASNASSSPRVLSIAPLAPPLSVTANIPTVKSAVNGSKQSAPSVPPSDLLAILNSGNKKSAAATGGAAGSVSASSSKSAVISANGPSRAELSVTTSPDLLAILKSGTKNSGSKSSVAPTAATSIRAPDQSAVLSSDAAVAPAQAMPQFPINYGMMMGIHPMYMAMMPPMPLPHPGPFPSSIPETPSTSRPVASAKVVFFIRVYFQYLMLILQGLARLLERAGIAAPPK